MKTIRAWHWTTADCMLRYGDSRKVVAGETITIDCEPVICEAGLHASVNIMDALNYAPGPCVWRVEVGGTVVKGDDKIAGTARKALWGFDATNLLWRFARRCASDVLHLWNSPDVVVRFLKTGDESLKAAAYSAAYSAEDSAARYAASSAAESAACSAAYYAAGYAAYSAAGSAAYSAAGSAARSAAYSAAGYAAYSAAGSAAESAARQKQARRLAGMIHAEHRKQEKAA